MNLMTKENFWNEIKERWPGDFELFTQWIDEYKKRSECEPIFYITDITSETGLHSVKYHDLPDAMQLGIFIQYTKETTHRFDFIIEEGQTFEQIINNIKEWFCEEYSWAKQEHLEGKYIDEESFPGDSFYDDYYGR